MRTYPQIVISAPRPRIAPPSSPPALAKGPDSAAADDEDAEDGDDEEDDDAEPVEKSGGPLADLLAMLRAAQLWFHAAHHVASGAGFAGDHALLYGDAYAMLGDEFDDVAERAVGLTGDPTYANPETVTRGALAHLTRWDDPDADDANALAGQAREYNQAVIDGVTLALDEMRGDDTLTDGTENLLQGIADAHEGVAYKLGRRVAKGALGGRFARLVKGPDVVKLSDDEAVAWLGARIRDAVCYGAGPMAPDAAGARSPIERAIDGVLSDMAYNRVAVQAVRAIGGVGELAEFARGVVDAEADVEGEIELPEDVGARAFAAMHLLARPMALPGLVKGATHRYIKRVPTGNAKRPWRYFYAVQHGHGVAHEAHMVEGAAFRHEGGHYHITKDHGDGHVTVRHDETGKEERVSKRELGARLEAHHAAAIAAHKERSAMSPAVRRQLTPEAREAKAREVEAARSKPEERVQDGKEGAGSGDNRGERGEGSHEFPFKMNPEKNFDQDRFALLAHEHHKALVERHRAASKTATPFKYGEDKIPEVWHGMMSDVAAGKPFSTEGAMSVAAKNLGIKPTQAAITSWLQFGDSEEGYRAAMEHAERTASQKNPVLNRVPGNFTDKTVQSDPEAAYKKAGAFVNRDSGMLSHPWHHKGAIYATDGHRAIMLPTTAAAAEIHDIQPWSNEPAKPLADMFRIATAGAPMSAFDAAALSSLAQRNLAAQRAIKSVAGGDAIPTIYFQGSTAHSDQRHSDRPTLAGKSERGTVDAPIGVNAKYLHDALKGIKGTVRVHTTDAYSPVVIEHESGEKHLIMPMRHDYKVVKSHHAARVIGQQALPLAKSNPGRFARLLAH